MVQAMGKEAEKNSTKPNGTKPGPPQAHPPEGDRPRPSRRFARYLLVILLAGAALLAWLSVLTYCPDDPPSVNVYPPQAVRNAAGAAGAYLAHTLRYWLGDGAYVLLTYATVLAGIWLAGGRVRHWPWRLVGLGALITVMASASYLIGPRGPEALMAGNILGVTVGEFLLGAFSPVGSWVVLLVTFGVGLMFTADRIVMRLPKAGKRLWDTRAGVSLRSWPGLGRRDAKPDMQHMPSAPRAAAAAPARAQLAARAKDRSAPEPPAEPRPVPV
ncbi:MAG: DNA translocase FtsK 4TM domain-containing protein, partial [Planctomycetota bacterium]